MDLYEYRWDHQEDLWQIFVSSLVHHPFYYARTLMQLGCEPIEPVPDTVFGHSALFLPNVFQYIGHIMQVDGLTGCFRGLFPHLLGQVLRYLYCSRLITETGIMPLEQLRRLSHEPDDEELFEEFCRNMKRDCVFYLSDFLITQPFKVISVRRMSQFVGRETCYDSMIGAINEIFEYDGISGFYAGFRSRLCYRLLVQLTTRYAIFLFSKYLLRQRHHRRHASAFFLMISEALWYPMQLISTCMMVSGSRLVVGAPPMMPLYTGIIDCWEYLSANGLTRRGATFFMRTVPFRPEMPKLL